MVRQQWSIKLFKKYPKEIKDFDVLLGDGGTALHVTSTGNGPQAAEHTGQGEPRIAEEGGVLGRHHGVLDHLRHLKIDIFLFSFQFIISLILQYYTPSY